MPEGALWVRLPRFIGDAVMITQAVAPLRALGHELVAWGPAPVVELFEGAAPYAGALADPAGKQGASLMADLLQAQRAGGVINLPRSLRATLAAKLAGLPLRVGWSPWLAGFLATHRLDYSRLQGHQLDRYRRLLRKAFPVLGEAESTPFLPRPTAQAQAQAMLAPRVGAAPYAVLAMGAMSWNKKLGAGPFAAAARHLQQRGLQVVLLGAPGEDQAHAALVVAQAPGVVDLSGQAPLSVAAGILSGAQVALGNDSALSHLAAACGVPVVVAFGPTDPALTCPRGPWVRAVRDESLPCLVCQRGDCRTEGHPCMQSLDAGLICRALDEGLAALPV
ncbi:MAG: glycosyltransferase family 9 protein [Holophagaceae bacterium]|nr:glycosyltransferase family 9 protein [Holophagaceae bacterium]